MNKNILDHIRKIQEQEANKKKKTANRGNSGKSIWHDWKDGANIARFVGDFIYTKSHYIGNTSNGPSVKLFDDSAFTGDNRILQTVNCANWDIQAETYSGEECVLCKLNKIAREIVFSRDPSVTDDLKNEFKLLKAKTDNRSVYRWNLIDRSHPVAEGENPFLIAKIGAELFDELCGIHREYQPDDLSSDDKGVDIKVIRSADSGRVKYKASMVFENKALKVTPLTDAELAHDRHDLLTICGKQSDQERIMTLLLPKWKELLADTSESSNENPF